MFSKPPWVNEKMSECTFWPHTSGSKINDTEQSWVGCKSPQHLVRQFPTPPWAGVPCNSLVRPYWSALDSTDNPRVLLVVQQRHSPKNNRPEPSLPSSESSSGSISAGVQAWSFPRRAKDRRSVLLPGQPPTELFSSLFNCPFLSWQRVQVLTGGAEWVHSCSLTLAGPV